MTMKNIGSYNVTTNLHPFKVLTSEKTASWNEWFAGIIDGDGCFYINKEKQISLEITTHVNDASILRNIKNQLKAGSVKLRSGSNSVRYRVKQRQIIVDIIKRLNGKLHNPSRLIQFKEACVILNISFIESPKFITHQNGYLSGLIDSDGTITISVSKSSQLNSQKSGKEGRIKRLEESRGFNQIYLKITSISKQNLILLEQSYKLGKICEEKRNLKNKSPNIKYNWIIYSYDEFIPLYEYLKKNPLKSVKKHRMRLVFYYFKYKQLKYNLKPKESIEYKIWSKFCKSWFKYTF